MQQRNINMIRFSDIPVKRRIIWASTVLVEIQSQVSFSRVVRQRISGCFVAALNCSAIRGPKNSQKRKRQLKRTQLGCWWGWRFVKYRCCNNQTWFRLKVMLTGVHALSPPKLEKSSPDWMVWYFYFPCLMDINDNKIKDIESINWQTFQASTHHWLCFASVSMHTAKPGTISEKISLPNTKTGDSKTQIMVSISWCVFLEQIRKIWVLAGRKNCVGCGEKVIQKLI